MPGFPQIQGERVDVDVALTRALKASSLTYEGKPFHAVMEIGAAGSEYSGRLEVWCVDQSKYRMVLTSPKFSQEKVVNGDKIFEKNDGDYYPRWLENFVLAVLDPVPMAKNFRGHGGAVMVGPQITNSCLRRDDRPGGITDQLTWGDICFAGSEPRLVSVLTTNTSIEFKDWKGFGKKQIARTYQTEVLDYQPVIGRLTKLEEIKQPDDSMFVVDTVTLVEQRISTEFVSTLKEESMVEKVPEIQWSSVREGKTEGYMIVYARTDRTGQVRETAKHNSDQPGLESFGMEQALQYKFKPLVIDGVARQMEMPLVLHFTSHLDDPLPILTVEQMKKQMVGCRFNNFESGEPAGIVVRIRVSVNETGKVTGYGPVGDVTWSGWLLPASQIAQCHLAPYVVNGRATYYKGDVEIKAP
ncbi:MAG TPA: hypothetical protein VIX90_08830 [Edaphobacter sp.]